MRPNECRGTLKVDDNCDWRVRDLTTDTHLHFLQWKKKEKSQLTIGVSRFFSFFNCCTCRRKRNDVSTVFTYQLDQHDQTKCHNWINKTKMIKRLLLIRWNSMLMCVVCESVSSLSYFFVHIIWWAKSILSNEEEEEEEETGVDAAHSPLFTCESPKGKYSS